MNFIIGASERVKVWANGLSTIALEVYPSELRVLLLAVQDRINHCKAELFSFGIPALGIVGSSSDLTSKVNQGKFNPMSFALMSTFYVNNAHIMWEPIEIDKKGMDRLALIEIDYRIVEQLTKALTSLFANEKQKSEDRAKAASLCIQLFELQQNYVYAAKDFNLVEATSEDSGEPKKVWPKARDMSARNGEREKYPAGD